MNAVSHRLNLVEDGLAIKAHRRNEQPHLFFSGLNPLETMMGAEGIPLEPKSSIFSSDYVPIVEDLVLEDLLTHLSPEKQELVSLLEEGRTQAEIATHFGIPTKLAYHRVRSLRKEVKRLLKDSKPARVAAYTVKPQLYWNEYAKTWKETFPFEGNDYAHAAEIRTRNRWMQRRGL